MPGFRTLFGPTAFGWHDRVLAQARYYIGFQVTDSTRNMRIQIPARGCPPVGKFKILRQRKT